MRNESGSKRSAGEAFWRFSLALYARPGVAGALLALQDRAGRDINLMLVALWLGATRGRAVDAARLAAAADIEPLNKGAVRELRRLRRALKTAADPDLQAMRRRVAALELATERTVQHRLASAAGDGQGPREADRLALAMANLARYLGEAAGSAEADILRRAVAALMRRG